MSPLTNTLGSVPVRHDVIPLAVGFGLMMVALGLGLWVSQRPDRGHGRASAGRAGWPAFIRYLVGTAVGGWALLMAFVLLYYVAVAGQSRAFLFAALTGTALMAFGIGVPSLLLIAGVGEILRRRRGRAPR